MTQLPATLVEAEALAFAREQIAYVRAGKLRLWGIEAGMWFEDKESQRACREELKQWALNDPASLMDAVEFARAGFELWDAALRELILQYQNWGMQMPTYLAAYAMELTRGTPQHRKSGRHRAGNVMRDIIVGVIVNMVIDRFRLRPTRNIASSRLPCACSIVAAALRPEGKGVAMSEANVVKIWKSMPPHSQKMIQIAIT